MKTLIIYDSAGNILFTKSPVEEDAFGCIIADIPTDRQPLKVVDGEVILDDTEEIKALKQRLEEISKEECNLKQELLEKELGGLL